MEKFEEHLQKSKQYVVLSDHILSTTYPVVKDPKILVRALEHVFLSVTNAMGALLHYERMFRRIPPFHNTFESKMNMFEMKIMQKGIFTEKDLTFIKDLYDTIVFHKKSPIEVAKKDEFVMFSTEYSIKKLSERTIRDYIQQTRVFITKVNQAIQNDQQLPQ